MNKKANTLTKFLLITIIIVIIILIIIFRGSNTNNIPDSQTNQNQDNPLDKSIYLIFQDNKTNCLMNGEIYVNDILLGEVKQREYLLSEKDYKNKFYLNSSLFIYGLTDSCFGEDNNLPFADLWEVSDLNYYFNTGENASFLLLVTPRSPRYYKEMQGFVRPEETDAYLKSNSMKSFTNNSFEDLEIIANHLRSSYISDLHQFGKTEYWQTPGEMLKNKMGDCEDWAVTTLSLMRAYNSSIRCYNALWETHISIFCYLNNNLIIYDMGKTMSKVRLSNEESLQDNQIALRNMRNRYFDDYGLPADERKLYALFNEKELFLFENDEDFINWGISLINESSQVA